MEYYWKAQFQIHLHTNGDKAMDLILENVEKLQTMYPRQNHKTTIEHAGYFTETQVYISKNIYFKTCFLKYFQDCY